MKKIIIAIIIIILIVLIALFLFTGGVRTDVHLINFEISENGKTMTMHVGVSSSAGYIRDMKQKNVDASKYLTFYSTYGINSKIGAKNTFTLEIDQNVDEIYFFKGNNGYNKILEKDKETGEWNRSKGSNTKELLNTKVDSKL